MPTPPPASTRKLSLAAVSPTSPAPNAHHRRLERHFENGSPQVVVYARYAGPCNERWRRCATGCTLLSTHLHTTRERRRPSSPCS
jgi:hypothetical protein